MAETVKIRLNELGPELLRGLKQRFRNAAVEITIRENPRRVITFKEPDFWEIIDQLDWSKQGDDDAVLQPAVKALSERSTDEICVFADILSEKLWLLDTEEHAKPFIDKNPRGHLSVDDFLYVRCCVVANGKKAFEYVLEHPKEIPDLAFARLLHLADSAYFLKTGQKMQYIPAYNYETYSNEGGWM